MDWWQAFADRVRTHEPLAERTWFRLGGAARVLFSPAHSEELGRMLRCADDAGVPVRVLGGGANLLVRDEGVDGLVIRLDQPAFTQVRTYGDRLEAGAGVDLMELARNASYEGWSGLECMAGIPGTVGGAVAMNAGGRYGQLGDVVESVRLMDRRGRERVADAADMGFGYRTSAVKEEVVLGVVIGLNRRSRERVKGDFQRIWREKKASQPLAAHSAGCIFKNPPGDSAGRLIDAAGMKGETFGRARVSLLHGNFIVADDGASAGEVLGLVDAVRERVLGRMGVRLELEIDVW